MIPSGVMVDKPSLLGEGMVIDLLMFFEEIKTVLTYKSNATSLIKISRGGTHSASSQTLDHTNEYLAGVGKDRFDTSVVSVRRMKTRRVQGPRSIRTLLGMMLLRVFEIPKSPFPSSKMR